MGHLVLSLEEAIKATTLLSDVLGVPLPRVLRGKLLSNHKPRHELAVIDHAFTTFLSRLLQEVERLDTLNPHPSREQGERMRKETIATLMADVEAFTRANAATSPILAAWDWLSSAETHKQAAFHVDFDQSTWRHPGLVSREMYDFGYGVVRGMVQLKTEQITAVLFLDEAGQKEILATLKEHRLMPPDSWK